MGKKLNAILLSAAFFLTGSFALADGVKKSEPKVPAKCIGWVMDFYGNFAGAGRTVTGISKIETINTTTYVSSDTTWFRLDFSRADTARFYVDGDSCFIFPNSGDSNQVYVKTGWNTTNLRMAVGDPNAVELSYFSAVPKINSILLNWRTESEYNSLEWRLYEEKTAQKELIGKIPASGNSNMPKEYYFSYPCKESRDYTFWLGELGLNGCEEFYGPVIGNPLVVKNKDELTYFPNPFSKEITFTYPNKNKEINANIYNNLGQVVKRLHGKGEIRWDGVDGASEKLPSGIYFFRELNDKNNKAHKIILMK